jgi:hypothetical protein
MQSILMHPKEEEMVASAPFWMPNIAPWLEPVSSYTKGEDSSQEME